MAVTASEIAAALGTTPQALAALLGHSTLVLQVRQLDASIAKKRAERDAAILQFEQELRDLQDQRDAAEAAANQALG